MEPFVRPAPSPVSLGRAEGEWPPLPSAFSTRPPR